MKGGAYFKMSELYHYGIPRRSGRYKWGSGDRPFQSSGGVASSNKKEKSYKRSVKKLRNIDTKQKTAQSKAEKKYEKAEKKSYSKFSSQKSVDKAYSKADVSQRKANRLAKKGEDYYNKMKKKYSKVGLDIDPETKKLGERYIELVAGNTRMLYAARRR